MVVLEKKKRLKRQKETKLRFTIVLMGFVVGVTLMANEVARSQQDEGGDWIRDCQPYTTCECKSINTTTNWSKNFTCFPMSKCTDDSSCVEMFNESCSGGHFELHKSTTGCSLDSSEQSASWQMYFLGSAIVFLIYVFPHRRLEKAPWHATMHRETLCNYLLTLLFFYPLIALPDSPGCVAGKYIFPPPCFILSYS